MAGRTEEGGAGGKMTRRAIVLYLLALFVPTIVIGAAVMALLCREQARINEQARVSARGAATIVADNLKLAVSAAEESLTEAMRGIEPGNETAALREWERANPLVRNVFVWAPGTGLVLPPAGGAGTVEERLFAARYSALFSGRVEFEEPAGEESVEPRRQLQQPARTDDYNLGNYGRRNALREIANPGRWSPSKSPQGKPDAGRKGIELSFASGWIPWFSENQLFLLGWARRAAGSTVFGVEVEMMSLMSHLVAAMPAGTPAGMIYALRDGTGRRLFQCGESGGEESGAPEFVVPLAPQLPHWEIAVHFISGGPAAACSSRFVVMGGLLAAILLAATTIGGVLLLIQAYRNMLDARQKTSFVSNVSHELKTPLTSIRMYAELISEKRVKDPAKVRHYLEVIVAESGRLTRLVNNVLDFGRLEQGRKKYRIEALDVAALLRNVLDAQQIRFNEAGMRLSAEIPDSPVFADLDRDAFEQAVLNLLDNAVKYADSGGEATVALDRGRSGSGFRLRVMDRGPGIPLAHRQRIFERFHRVDDTLTAAKPGSGLGLTIARRLVRDMGGDILFEQREGGGSCFIVVFDGGNGKGAK